MIENIQVTAKRNFVPKDNDLYVVIGKRVFSDFSEFSFQRDIEQIPSSFEMTIPIVASEFPKEIKDNQELMIYKNKKQVFHGYMEQFNVSVQGNQQHSLTIAGRSKVRDLCDPNPIIGGTSIENVQGLSDLVQIFSTMYNVPFINKSVVADKTAWGSVPFNLGDTAFDVISRYARYEGKLLYDDGYGSLIINDVVSSGNLTFNSESPLTSYMFESDLTNRFKEYRVYWQPFTTQSQTGLPPYKAAFDPEPQIWNATQRIKVMINSTSDENGSIAARLATYEANRQWGRSKSIRITLSNWKDADQQFYDVNQLVSVDLPLINVHQQQMVITNVNYQYSNDGSYCTLTLYPQKALGFEPVALYTSQPGLQALPES